MPPPLVSTARSLPLVFLQTSRMRRRRRRWKNAGLKNDGPNSRARKPAYRLFVRSVLWLYQLCRLSVALQSCIFSAASAVECNRMHHAFTACDVRNLPTLKLAPTTIGRICCEHDRATETPAFQGAAIHCFHSVVLSRTNSAIKPEINVHYAKPSRRHRPRDIIVSSKSSE